MEHAEHSLQDIDQNDFIVKAIQQNDNLHARMFIPKLEYIYFKMIFIIIWQIIFLKVKRSSDH